MSDQANKTPFWKGTNFWLAALLFVGSFFGLPKDTAQTTIMAVVGVVGAFGAARQFMQSAKWGGFIPTLLQPNTLNYLVSVLTLIGIPQADQLTDGLNGLVEAVVAGNWGLFITRLFSFGTIIFYLVRKK